MNSANRLLGLVMVISLAVCGSGCFVTTLKGNVATKTDGRISGRYCVKSVETDSLNVDEGMFVRYGLENGVFVGATDAEQLSVKISHETLDGRWNWLQIVNTVPACCTWFAWPISMPGGIERYRIEVHSKHGLDVVGVDVAKTRWCSIWTPLGFVPALFADDNVYGENQTHGELIEASRKVAESYVFDAVKDAIGRRNYLRRREPDRGTDHVEERLNDGCDKNTIRVFVLKEMPTLWSSYQDLLATIVDSETMREKLDKALRRTGRDPGSDDDYKQICLECERLKKTQKDAWGRFEDAYLASCKYEANPKGKDRGACCIRPLGECLHDIRRSLLSYRKLYMQSER